MVSVYDGEGYARVVMTPNRSLSWRGNKLVILSLLAISGVISVGFLLVGAWVILPFAGIEILTLTAALYYVSWKLSYRHVIDIYSDTVVLQKGVKFPKFSKSLKRSDVKITLQEAKHDWDGPDIFVTDRTGTIPVGEFLNKEDRHRVIDELRSHNIAVSKGEICRLSL